MLSFFKKIPLATRLAQCVYLASLVVYLLFFYEGSFFPTFYSTLAAMAICMVVMFLSAVQKQWALLCMDLFLAVVLFLHYISYA
jgi:hypothetical protein